MRAGPLPSGPPVVLRCRRRPFGLDAPRPPDVRRIERDILAWLAERMPAALALRAQGIEGRGAPAAPDADVSATLVLLLPCRQTAVLRIEARPDRPRRDTLAFAEGCVRRKVPLAVVTTLAEARAALRRWGFEPERS